MHHCVTDHDYYARNSGGDRRERYCVPRQEGSESGLRETLQTPYAVEPWARQGRLIVQTSHNLGQPRR